MAFECDQFAGEPLLLKAEAIYLALLIKTLHMQLAHQFDLSKLRLRYGLQPRDMHVLCVNPLVRIPTEVQKHRDLIHVHRGVAHVVIQLELLGRSFN